MSLRKTASLVLAAAMLALTAVTSSAVTCDSHNYTEEHREANCLDRSHTVYTCTNCGDSYVKYDYEFTEPDGLYVLARSEKSSDKVTLRVYIYNNPGLSTVLVRVYHNADAVAPAAVERGELWSKGVFDIKSTTPGYVTVYAESDSVYSDGLFFTVTYNITDSDADSGIRVHIGSKSFMDFDVETKETVDRKPILIDLVGKNDLGDHAWLFDKIITEPDLEKSGETRYICAVCGEEKVEPGVPAARWLKGDLNNSGSVNTKDVYLMKRYLAGHEPTDDIKWFEDAADINGDGTVNAVDSALLKRILVGRF